MKKKRTRNQPKRTLTGHSLALMRSRGYAALRAKTTAERNVRRKSKRGKEVLIERKRMKEKERGKE